MTKPYTPADLVPQLVTAALPFVSDSEEIPASGEQDLERLAAESASPVVVEMLAVACAVMADNLVRLGQVPRESLIRNLQAAMQVWAQRRGLDVS